MNAIESRLLGILHNINLNYKTNIGYRFANENLAYGSKFFAVCNRNLVRQTYHNAGMYTDMEHWSDERCTNQILSVLGLLDAVKVTSHFEEDTKMSYSDPQQQQTDLKEAAGKRVAETLLPFIRTDVPLSGIYKFASLVATWSGYGDSSAFNTGFMTVFFEYKDAQKYIPQETESSTKEE